MLALDHFEHPDELTPGKVKSAVLRTLAFENNMSSPKPKCLFRRDPVNIPIRGSNLRSNYPFFLSDRFLLLPGENDVLFVFDLSNHEARIFPFPMNGWNGLLAIRTHTESKTLYALIGEVLGNPFEENEEIV